LYTQALCAARFAFSRNKARGFRAGQSGLSPCRRHWKNLEPTFPETKPDGAECAGSGTIRDQFTENQEVPKQSQSSTKGRNSRVAKGSPRQLMPGGCSTPQCVRRIIAWPKAQHRLSWSKAPIMQHLERPDNRIPAAHVWARAHSEGQSSAKHPILRRPLGHVSRRPAPFAYTPNRGIFHASVRRMPYRPQPRNSARPFP
jgi:hypothetical protein